ncbi:MAG: hypothetical protein WCA07_08265 [Gloeobacterales cyanobacterium]
MYPDEDELEINDAGLGVTVGDWQFGVAPKGSTDDRYDTPENRRRAEQQEEDKREAQRRGEQGPEEWWKPSPSPAISEDDPVTRSIREANERLHPQEPMIIHDPLTGKPVVLDAQPEEYPEIPAEESTPSEPGDYPLPPDDPAWA